MNQPRMPSPAILVAVLALVAALAGTAIAEPDVTTSAVSKKKVKKIATKQINELAPGLSVAHADTAASAQNAAHADTAASAQNTNSLDGLNSSDFLRSNDPSSIPTVQATRDSEQVIPDDDSTVLTWDAERYDTASMHDNTTNTERLTAPVDGIYAVTLQVDWDFNATGRRTVSLTSVHDGNHANVAIEDRSPTDDGFANHTLTIQVQLAAGDYVEAAAVQQSGGNLNVLAGTAANFSMAWLAPGP